MTRALVDRRSPKLPVASGRSEDAWCIQLYPLLLVNKNRAQQDEIATNSEASDGAGGLFTNVYRVRENVMHEIGFFQGSYGRTFVVLLHEEGVNVPTNL